MLDAIRRQGDSLLRDLSPAERSLVEAKVSELSVEHRRLGDAAQARHKELAQDLAQREALQQDIDRAASWLTEKELLIAQTPNIRLKAVDIEKQIDKYKVAILFPINVFLNLEPP